MGASLTQQDREGEGRTRWFQRVVPVTGLVLAVVALAALVLPSVRHQVALSTTRQPQPYVELSFARPTPRAMCGQGKPAQVRFQLVSHLEQRRRLAYRVVVDGAGTPARTLKGSIPVDPGRSRVVRAPVAAPASTAYTVAVRLPARHQQILAHCPAGRS